MLAQIVEEVSVLAADMRRKKPRQLPRPTAKKTASAQRSSKLGPGFQKMIAVATQQGRVRVVPDG